MSVLERLTAELDAGRPAALVTVLAGPPAHAALVGRKLLAGPAGAIASELDALPELAAAALAAALDRLARGQAAARTLRLPAGEFRLYAEPYAPPPTLLVVGSGHVAQPLAAMGKLAGFRVAVLDDRPEYANRARFPTADLLVVDDFLPGLRRLPIGPGWQVVLVTRGHTHDMACLRELLDRPVDYLGMIGSRHRVRAVFEMLQAEGADPARLERVHAPIGLDLGADTPAEIAVAILAELVWVRRGVGDGRPLREQRRRRPGGPAGGAGGDAHDG